MNVKTNSVTGSAGGVKHRRRQHGRISRVMPMTREDIAALQWLLAYASFMEISHNEQASCEHADDAEEWYRSWHSSDPQCARSWSGSRPSMVAADGDCWYRDYAEDYVNGKSTPYMTGVPFSGDFSDVEPAWLREEHIGYDN